MYTSIRRYDGVTDADEVVRRAIGEFAPLLAERTGFQGYWVVKGGDDVVASITVFETREQADASAEAAAEWARERLGDLSPNPPQVTAGETTAAAANATG
jgi:heme-degrading monooxygenase HmoA